MYDFSLTFVKLKSHFGPVQMWSEWKKVLSNEDKTWKKHSFSQIWHIYEDKMSIQKDFNLLVSLVFSDFRSCNLFSCFCLTFGLLDVPLFPMLLYFNYLEQGSWNYENPCVTKSKTCFCMKVEIHASLNWMLP